MLRAFPQDEQDAFVSDSTAGPIWEQNSSWFFVTLPAEGKRPSETYFVVRPHWNKRLIVDTATGNHVDLKAYRGVSSVDEFADAPDDIKRLLTATIELEKRRALGALAVPGPLKGDERWRAYRDLSAALHDVGFFKLDEAEPKLRELEAALGDAEGHGQLRTKLRETLRRQGKTPSAGYGVRLYAAVDRGSHFSADSNRSYVASVPVEARTANAPRVAAGMTIKELTDLLGCPDAEVYDAGHGYDYDIDDVPAYTLRIMTDPRTQTVTSVKRIEPVAFLHDPARTRE